MPTPPKSCATELPTTTSLAPGRNIRPSTIRTWLRSCSPSGERPRTGTLVRCPVPRFLSESSTTTSRDTSVAPSAPRATCGKVSTTAAESRSTPLCTSVSDPLRMTTAFESLPLDTIVAFNPASSISTALKTNTTSAMPPAVSTVVSRRTHRLRAT